MSEEVEREAKLKEVVEQSDSKSTTRDESSTSNNAPKTNDKTDDDRADVVETKENTTENDADAEGDSEAETWIQSPEKKKNILESAPSLPPPKTTSASDISSTKIASTSDKENSTRKRKRLLTNERDDARSTGSSRRSSSLSSPAAQEISDVDTDRARHVRRNQLNRNGQRNDTSESEDKLDFPKKRRRRPSEVIPPSPSHKRSKNSSIDTTERRETRSATYPRPSDDEGSPSPEPPVRREHRRGASTQLTSHEFERKKRGRPPLINTRRNRSVDRGSVSSDGSEPTRRSRPALHKFTSDQDNMSPAKVGPRKWKDKNGRTYLARACANEDLETAKARLAERPEDLNMDDNAGNTPLQIASLEGYVEIVRFLLTKGAEINVRNLDKDTPLIDAVENGHVEVIRLLLNNGANPRMGNAKGDEPYELVPTDDDNYQEIRKMLMNAKGKEAKKNILADQIESGNRDGASSRAASAASPRDSPPVGPRSPPAFGSRRRTGRSESTRNDLLWQANTQENLAKLAGKGDVQGVASILSILEKAETESLIAAAKAGHEEVLQLLIAMGRPDPDPDPVRSSKMGPGYNTPMLAAIGRGHPDVVGLLANQSGFNPMRRFRQKTYYELAQERRGDKWEQEHKILKVAYDKYATAKGRKTSSPRKTRDIDKSDVRPPRKSSSPASIKRQSASPSITHKSLPTKPIDASQKDKRKASDPSLEKRKSTSKQEMTDGAVASDVDQTSTVQKKTHRTRRSQSDLPPPQALEMETAYKRKRLLTGKEHRSRQTNATSSDIDAEDMIEVKQEEKSGSVLKRTRSSLSPEPSSIDVDKNRVAVKKRRTVLESSPDDTRSSAKVSTPPTSKELADEEAKPPKKKNDSKAEASTSKITEAISLAESIEKDPVAVTEEANPATIDPEILPDAVSSEVVVDQIVADASNIQEEQEKTAAEAAKKEAEMKAREKEEAERAAAAAAAEAQRLEEERKAREAREAEEAEARRKAEEEAQAKKKAEEDRQEQLRKEMENRRRQQQLEEERRRVEALPIVLGRTAQMIDENDPEVKSTLWLNKYLPLYTVTTQQLESNTQHATSNDEWIANFQAAGLLATKDLNLRSYTSFEKRIVSPHERRCLWRVARLKLSYDFNPMWNTTVSKATELEKQAEIKFTAMDNLFWVKLSDFLDQVSRFPHLTGLDLRRQPISLKSYGEILSSLNQVNGILPSPKPLPNGITDQPIYGSGSDNILS